MPLLLEVGDDPGLVLNLLLVICRAGGHDLHDSAADRREEGALLLVEFGVGASQCDQCETGADDRVPQPAVPIDVADGRLDGRMSDTIDGLSGVIGEEQTCTE